MSEFDDDFFYDEDEVGWGNDDDQRTCGCCGVSYYGKHTCHRKYDHESCSTKHTAFIDDYEEPRRKTVVERLNYGFKLLSLGGWDTEE